MKEFEKITVVVVCDNHYIPMLAVLVKSIEANLCAASRLDLWIIDDNIAKLNKGKLEKSINQKITTIIWQSAKSVIPKGFHLPLDKSTFPLNIYLWYFVPYFLPKEVSRVLCIDVDMINCRDLTELWKTDLGDKIAGAVIDPRVRTFECDWGGILNFEQLGLNGNSKYFNSGLVLINLQKWRKNDITEKALTIIEENIDFAVYPEQYGINIALHNQWLELNPLWNFFATATNNTTPYMIHFVDRKPIYDSYINNPSFKQLFFMYLCQTEWSEFRTISETRRYIKKINNVMYKMLKRIVSFFIFKPKKTTL